MNDPRDKKQNNDDLDQVKSLIGDADGGLFSVDDILAEYGTKKPAGRTAVPLTPREEPLDLPWPAARPHPPVDNVLSFPDLAGEEPSPEQAAPVEEISEEDQEDQEDNILDFPQEESALTAFLRDLSDKADRYADQMFSDAENTDMEEVRRLEALIPGTDREEHPQERGGPPPEPKHRREPPPPPDYTPQELIYRCCRNLKGLRVRAVLLLVLACAALIQLAVPALGYIWLAPLDSMVLQCWISVGLLGAGVLLSLDVLLRGLVRALRLKTGMDTLLALACGFTLADGILLALSPAPERLPYTVVALFGLHFLLHGSYHYKCGMRLSCRTAAASSTPYRVTLDEGMWNGQDTYTKWSGDAEHFGSQLQAEDGAQRIFARLCPLLLIADVVIALTTSLSPDRPDRLVWSLSALFTATAAFGGALVYGLPFHMVARRLGKSGAVLAGWPGIARSRRGRRVLVTDVDLFPPGYVELNGYKVLSDLSAERVLGYTTTLIKASGSTLVKPFYDELRAMGGLLRKAERLCCYEGGGLSATIRSDEVLVGSASFMSLMDVDLPDGLRVNSAVFCAINGELAGIFALSYSLPDTVFPALELLLEEKVGPVLATRDFNLIPAMLAQRFKLAADKMDFPPVERRRELSDPDHPHSQVLTALLCREGLFPFAETITAARRLRWATRAGALLCCLSSFFGLLLAAYLTSVAAYTALSPLNLLLYMLLWLLPIRLLTGWVHRY